MSIAEIEPAIPIPLLKPEPDLEPETDDRGTSPPAAVPAPPDFCDQALLSRFVARQDEGAFRQLVTRHGAMVLAVARRVVRCQAEAEDVFQATFLTLSRKAKQVREARSLAAWLYQTAFRCALRARGRRQQRREHSLEMDVMQPTGTLRQIADDHEQSIVDEELNRLPEQLRLPLFLCCLEGRSREEAAEQLGWSLGSLKGRLERGRQLLRRRLLLRGVSMTWALTTLSAWNSASAATANVPRDLIEATVQAGVQTAQGGGGVGGLSPEVTALVEGQPMLGTWAAWKLAGLSLTASGLITVGGLNLTAASSPAGNAVAPSQLESRLGENLSPMSPIRVVAYFADGEGQPSPEKKRDGQGPTKGPKDGERAKFGPKDGEGRKSGPKEGDGVQKPGQKEGARGEKGMAAEGANPKFRPGEKSPMGDKQFSALRDFQPQSPREKLLYQMIMELQAEVAALKRQGGMGEGKFREAGAGPREGEKKPFREGEKQPMRDGEKPFKSGEKVNRDQ